jgi:hypothetical protein
VTDCYSCPCHGAPPCGNVYYLHSHMS